MTMTSDVETIPYTGRVYSEQVMEKVRLSGTTTASKFARLCIRKRVPVSWVAQAMGVSRVTVYKWFRGDATPSATNQRKLRALADKIRGI
jgi:DNA-binding transcriptional regulator YiaG